MKKALMAAFAALELLLLGALLALALAAKAHGGKLLAVPRGIGSQGFDPARIEELWEGEFLLTYEARQTKVVQAIHSRHTVTVVAANERYGAVMGYRMLSGGFFTEAARKDKSRRAVLNEAAAFALFGGRNVAGNQFKLDGETWTVAGVMDDGADDSRVYAPATTLDVDVQSFLALLGGEVTREYATGALKSLGIYEDQYDMIDLGAEASGYWERFSLAGLAALCAWLARLLRFLLRGAAARYRAIRGKLARMYLRDLFSRELSGLLKAALIVAILILGAAAAVLLLTRILDSALILGELSLGTERLLVHDFAETIAWLQEHFVLGNVLFAAALLASAAGAVMGLGARRLPSGGER